MLDDYKETKFYDYVKNLKQFYHAYIFEVDDIKESFPIILAFTKMIVCKSHYTSEEKCENCNICHLIDQNYYEDLIIVDPDGQSIKKEQILNLQRKFSLKSSNNTNQVYIIRQAEKMNPSSSNALLKFIEEPEEGIYGILITTDRSKLLPTILSRCNLISLKSSKKVNYTKEEIQPILDFLGLFHDKKEDTIAYLKSNFFSYYQTKEEIVQAFFIMELVLDTKLNTNYHITLSLPEEICDIINSSLKNLSNSDLIFYLDKIITFKNLLLSVLNINLNLFMDRFIIEMAKVIK